MRNAKLWAEVDDILREAYARGDYSQDLTAEYLFNVVKRYGEWVDIARGLVGNDEPIEALADMMQDELWKSVATDNGFSNAVMHSFLASIDFRELASMALADARED